MKRIKDLLWIATAIGILGYLVSKIRFNSFTDNFLKDNAKTIKAIIIDDKNYEGNQPVKPKYTYSYQFKLGGKEYIGNSHEETLTVGDSIEVIYNKSHPEINKPLHLKE